MQKCKYLDDIGLKINEYGTNFMPDDDHRADSWNKDRYEYGFDVRETWNLDITFIEWIYTRLMMYKERTCVDLNVHKISYKKDGIKIKLTQAEAIDRILELAKEILVNRSVDNNVKENKKEICKIWTKLICLMWW